MPSPDAGALSFADLVDARRELNEAVQRHRASVNYFATTSGFARTADDPKVGSDSVPELEDLPPGGQLRGVTTSLTCFESLQTVILDSETSDPEKFSGLDIVDKGRLKTFVGNAASRTLQWRSEGAARRYCIVRATAPILRIAPPGDTTAINDALRWVWQQVGEEAGYNAIYEVAPPRGGTDAAKDPNDWNFEDDDPNRRYPPNAFLTYWGLRSLALLPTLLQSEDIAPKVAQAELWLASVIGRETALHYASNRDRDPQQLAWGICGVVASTDRALADRSDGISGLVEAGLKAFFEQQAPDGSWETGRALFHYPEAGNAYCYIYETLAELLSLAVDERHDYQDEMRRMLVPYAHKLLRAMSRLTQTSRQLGSAGVGWSSGHHPHRTSPESWATATVYRFLQALRRFVGAEVRRLAAVRLRARRPRKDLTDLAKFGQTWDTGRGAAGDLLASLFVHPSAAYVEHTDAYDPDRPQLSRRWARSAILYGPPGTGKTTLAEAVAGALEWTFVEITPAEFLDQGMEQVSARADEIFRQLMQLDRAVVLFDEIDELIRRRDAGSNEQRATDMVGRFFTTTMLPRLARLWDARKVIFFVNTNAMHAVDTAVRRSQRFDATLLVMPPGMGKRLAMLDTSAHDHVKPEVVEALLKDPAWEDDPSLVRLGWLPFLRHDQLERLEGRVFHDRDQFYADLEAMGMELKSDWVHASTEVEPHDDAKPHKVMQWVIKVYQSEVKLQRLDQSRQRFIVLPNPPPATLSDDFSTDDAPEGYAQWLGTGSPEEVMDGAGRIPLSQT